jgi:ABC-2 type transport system ATP-binding protein
MQPILEVKNITKIYRRPGGQELKAVDNVSFQVNAGEVVGFLGPNGAGKSTAIKIITGIAHPTSGTISIMGHNISTQREQAMKYVGGVIESPDLYVDWTGYENLKYFATLHPRDTMDDDSTRQLKKRQLDEKRIAEVLETVGMTSRQKEKVKRYSLGMKQRLGISQALLNNPKLLILDEPANGLDPAGIKDIRDLLKRLAHEQNMAILVSSHQLAEMQLMCDRILIINKGKIIAEKKITELTDLSQGQTLVLTTDKPTEATALLKEKFGITATIDQNTLTFVTDKATSEITRELVLAGINIYGVQTKEGSLEELFISLTKGGSINVQ